MWKNVLLAILAGALIVLIVLCRNASLLLSIAWPTTTQLKTILNLLQSALTIVALLVGAAWVYYNYLKGRTYEKRLQSEVSAEIVALNGQHHLLATLKLENVGLSNVVLKNSTALEVWAYETLGHVDDILVLSEVRWGGELATIQVFEGTELEPGETIQEQRLILIHGKEPVMAFRLFLRSFSDSWIPAFRRQRPFLRWKSFEWDAMNIVTLNSENGIDTNDGDEDDE